MTKTSLVSFIALAMVPSVVWLSVDVVRHYWPRVLRPFNSWRGEDYLIAGVLISFTSAASLNGVFWGVHFLAHEMGWAMIEAQTYKYGQLANIFTRNFAYIAAAGLHLAAAWKYGMTGVRHPGYYLARTILLTFICFGLLMLA